MTTRPQASAFYPSLAFLALIFALVPVAAQPMQAQTYTVIHAFSGYPDGATPFAGLTMANADTLYGTAWTGAYHAEGAVFSLKRSGSSWTYSNVYNFQQGNNDGHNPQGGVTMDRNGKLYGTTTLGGSTNCSSGCGVVYKLTPPRNLGSWTETILHFFNGSDGANPAYGNLIFDQAGNLYGTTTYGGTYNHGTVFELTPSNGSWTQTVLWNFTGGSDASDPWSGLTLDSDGNLDGTTSYGGTYGRGNVFKLARSGSGWTLTNLFSLNGFEGNNIIGGVAMDSEGNLYGTATEGGPQGGGTVFELVPSNGGWAYRLIGFFAQGIGPVDTPTLDAAGNLYLTTLSELGNGSVVKFVRSNAGWQSITLTTFEQNDGSEPYGSVILDPEGNIYGTASSGGSEHNGTAFEITP